MKIKRGNDGGVYAVFKSEDDAWKWNIFRRPLACFGGYMNAWRLI